MRNVRIDTPSGGNVPLGDVTDLRIAPAPNVVMRESASRRIDVTLDVKGRDLGTVAREVETKVRGLSFDNGYHPEFLGEYAARQASRNRLLALSGLALLGILMILYADFRSVRLTGLVFASFPFALVGGVAGAFLAGGVLSLGALVGFVTVLGIAARNGIMLVSHYRHLEENEGMAVRRAAHPARLGGTALADPHDRHRDGPRTAAHRHHGRASRSGDRAPDGRRDPRRPRVVDVLELVPDARALFARPQLGDREVDRQDRAGRLSLVGVRVADRYPTRQRGSNKGIKLDGVTNSCDVGLLRLSWESAKATDGSGQDARGQTRHRCVKHRFGLTFQSGASRRTPRRVAQWLQQSPGSKKNLASPEQLIPLSKRLLTTATMEYIALGVGSRFGILPARALTWGLKFQGLTSRGIRH